MSQNQFNVLGRTLRHTSLGVLCWLEVIDLDPFLGFLFLVPHFCHFSFAEAVEAANKINATNFDFISCFEPTKLSHFLTAGRLRIDWQMLPISCCLHAFLPGFWPAALGCNVFITKRC